MLVCFLSDRTVVNLELRLQAMLVGENDARSIESSVSRYLALKYQKDSDPNSIKKAANEVLIYSCCVSFAILNVCFVVVFFDRGEKRELFSDTVTQPYSLGNQSNNH